MAVEPACLGTAVNRLIARPYGAMEKSRHERPFCLARHRCGPARGVVWPNCGGFDSDHSRTVASWQQSSRFTIMSCSLAWIAPTNAL
jgi:hypothetical protein